MAKLIYSAIASLDGYTEGTPRAWLFLGPVIVGGGKPALPGDVYVRLELMGEHRLRPHKCACGQRRGPAPFPARASATRASSRLG